MRTLSEKFPLQVASCVGACNLGGGVFRLDFANGTSRQATAQEISAAQASVDSDATDEATVAAAKTAARSDYTTMQTIINGVNAGTLTNGQRDAAIKQQAQAIQHLIRAFWAR